MKNQQTMMWTQSHDEDGPAQEWPRLRDGLVLARALDATLPAPSWPEHFVVRRLAPEADLERWVNLVNDSFDDGRGFKPTTVREQARLLARAEYSAARDLVAVAPDGSLAACCRARLWSGTAPNGTGGTGWITVLAVRRSLCALGLRREMLLTALQVLKAAGLASALVSVAVADCGNLVALCRALGFQASGFDLPGR